MRNLIPSWVRVLLVFFLIFIGIEYFCEETHAYVMQPYIFPMEERVDALKMIYQHRKAKGRLIELHVVDKHCQD
mgnify:CR=1 FL=1